MIQSWVRSLTIKAGTGYPKSLCLELMCDGGRPAGAQFGAFQKKPMLFRWDRGRIEMADTWRPAPVRPRIRMSAIAAVIGRLKRRIPMNHGEHGCNSIAIAMDRPGAQIGSTPLGDAQMTSNEFTAKWNYSQGSSHDRRFVNASDVK